MRFKVPTGLNTRLYFLDKVEFIRYVYMTTDEVS